MDESPVEHGRGPVARVVMADRRVLRVFFDHGFRWPLWEVGDKTAMEPSDYAFSPGLVLLLQEWHGLWEAIADYDIGQPVPEPAPGDREAEQAAARAAVDRIRTEIPRGITVDASLIGL